MIVAGRRYSKRQLAWIFSGITLIVLTIGIILAGNGSAPVPEPAPIILNNGKILGNRIISKAWSLEYKSITTSPDGVTVDVGDVHSGIFYKNGKPYIKFHTPHASGNTATLDLTADGGIHLETIGGAVHHTFYTDTMEWNNGLQMLTLPHAVTFTSDSEVLHVSSISVSFLTGKTVIKGIRGNVRF